MVRLGQKSTIRTKQLNVREQKPTGRIPHDFHRTLNAMKVRANELADVVQKTVASFQSAKTTPADILEHLEYADEKFDFYDALIVTGAVLFRHLPDRLVLLGNPVLTSACVVTLDPLLNEISPIDSFPLLPDSLHSVVVAGWDLTGLGTLTSNVTVCK